MHPIGRMVPVAVARDPFHARVLAARLGAAGIVWELRGGDGPYPVGEVEVLVDEAEARTALALLADEEHGLADEEHGLADEVRIPAPAPGRAPFGLWFVVAAVVVVALFALGRLLAAAA